jgi:hypothetical protein
MVFRGYLNDMLDTVVIRGLLSQKMTVLEIQVRFYTDMISDILNMILCMTHSLLHLEGSRAHLNTSSLWKAGAHHVQQKKTRLCLC